MWAAACCAATETPGTAGGWLESGKDMQRSTLALSFPPLSHMPAPQHTGTSALNAILGGETVLVLVAQGVLHLKADWQDLIHLQRGRGTTFHLISLV